MYLEKFDPVSSNLRRLFVGTVVEAPLVAGKVGRGLTLAQSGSEYCRRSKRSRLVYSAYSSHQTSLTGSYGIPPPLQNPPLLLSRMHVRSSVLLATHCSLIPLLWFLRSFRVPMTKGTKLRDRLCDSVA